MTCDDGEGTVALESDRSRFEVGAVDTENDLVIGGPEEEPVVGVEIEQIVIARLVVRVMGSENDLHREIAVRGNEAGRRNGKDVGRARRGIFGGDEAGGICSLLQLEAPETRG